MVKTKQPARVSKKSTNQASTPESADEYQSLADEEESRGGKWRAGDAAKSARAFERALGFYEQGLEQFPKNFDLAYNKARLQLELSQRPALLPHWGLAREEFLAQTLLSHRRALAINDDDADLLFNTAQVLTSSAEELSKDGSEASAVPLLHEALEILSSCLAKQEMMLEQQNVEMPDEIDDEDESGGVAIDQEQQPLANTSEREEESATVIQPVMPSDLLDTVHASLSALTTLVAIEEDPSALSNLDSMARMLYEKKAETYVSLVPAEEKERLHFTVHLDRAIFICALANARYSAQEIQVRTLMDSLENFNIPNKASHADALTAEAEARTEAVLSALEQLEAAQDVPVMDCWRQLSMAQEGLSQATKLDDDTAKGLKAQIYMQKGDVELLRIRTASLPTPAISETIRNSRPTLLKNARTFYRGALAHASSSDDAETHETTAERLQAVDFLTYVDNNSQPVITSALPHILSELVSEGLLSTSILDSISAMVG